MHPRTPESALASTGPAILARLERLPFTRFHRRIVVIVGTAYLFDAADVALLTFVLAPISKEFGLTAVQAGVLGSATFAGVAIGSTIGGWLSDRFGRRPVFTVSMLVWGMASLLMALSWDFGSVVAFRFVTGIGMGAELPVALALTSELLPSARRAAYLGAVPVLAALSYLFAGGATLLLGWRGAFVLMFVLSLFAFVVRRGLPESIRWNVTHGAIDKAEATLRTFESHAPKSTVDYEPVVAAEKSIPATRGPLRDLFSKSQRGRTAVAWAMWFFQLLAQYGINVWIAKLLVDRGASVTSSIGMTMLMLVWGIPGALLAASQFERFGRKPVYAVSAVVGAMAALWYGLSTSTVMVVVAGSALHFCLAAMAAGLYAYTPELFATGARATGTGVASAVGRVGSVLGPLVIPAVLVTWGYLGTFVALSSCFAVAGALVLIFGPETRGKSLEAVTGT